MKIRVIGFSLLTVSLISVIIFKVNPAVELGMVGYGLLIAGLYFGVMLSLNVFNRNNLKT